MSTSTPAFETLVRRYHAAVYATARRIVRSPDDAADVTQQVFLNALGHADEILACEDPCAKLTWLASKLALTHLRGARNRKRREEAHAMTRDHEYHEHRPEDRELLRAVRRTLDELPDELRLPLVLRYQEDMTLSAAAGALSCAESTVHERIKRGLERLRQRLNRAGFALSVAALPEIVATNKNVTVPVALEDTLLGLAKSEVAGAGMLAMKSALLVPALVVVAAVGALFWLPGSSGANALPAEVGSAIPGDPGQGESSRPGTSPTRVEVPFRPAPVASPAAREKRARLVELRGVVRNRAGVPLAGALVSATTMAYWGKRPVFSRMVRTGNDGSFRVEVPVDRAGGLRYRLWARLEGHVAATSDPFLVRPGARVQPKSLTLVERSKPRAGRYELDVEVGDTSGRPIQRAFVQVYGYDPDRPAWAQPEASGRTDADGHCRIRGQALGDKEVVIDARYVGGRRIRTVFEVRSGSMHKKFVLAPALQITGTVRDTNNAPVAGFELTRYRGSSRFDGMTVFTKSDGRFVLHGLGEGPYSVFGRGNPDSDDHWSPFVLDGVAAGSRGLLLIVKRRSDPRDHGLHAGEIHGRVVDAVTGKPIVVSELEVHYAPLPGDDPDALARELHASLVHPRPVQTAVIGRLPEPSPEFHEVGLSPGTYVVYVELPGRAVAMTRPIRLAAEQIVTNVVVRVDDGATVSGVVRDPDGRPKAGAIVFVCGQDERARQTLRDLDGVVSEPGDRRLSLPAGAVATDAAGRFTIPRIPAGLPVVVVALHESFRPIQTRPISLVRGEKRIGVDLRFTQMR